MNAPASNLFPSASNGASAASILTPASTANRNVASLLSPLCSITSTLPFPLMPPARRASAVSRVIGWASTPLSSTLWTTTLRISVALQPVSSYGDGFCGGKNCVPSSVFTSTLYGWSIRTTKSPAATSVEPALNGAFAVCTSAPCRRSMLTVATASPFRYWLAGITHAYGASFLPRSTARLPFR